MDLLLVTSAIIVHEDKILLVRRAREPFKDYWSFIGGIGAFDQTNDPLEAVKIEVLGDINCDFHPTFFTYNFDTFKAPTITLFFYGTITGTVKAQSKYVSEFKWFNIKEAASMQLGFDHNKILDKFLEEKHNKY